MAIEHSVVEANGLDAPGAGPRGGYQTSKRQKEVYAPTLTVSRQNVQSSNFAYLNLQDIISTNPFVMHFMVGIVRVASAFIFDECETAQR